MSDWVETQVSIVANRCLLSRVLRREHVPSRLRNLSRCVLLRLRVSPIQFSKVETFCRFGLPKLGARLGACKFFLFRLSPDMLRLVSQTASCRLSCESGLYSGPERVVQVFSFPPQSQHVAPGRPERSVLPLLRERPLFKTGASRASFLFRRSHRRRSHREMESPAPVRARAAVGSDNLASSRLWARNFLRFFYRSAPDRLA